MTEGLSGLIEKVVGETARARRVSRRGFWWMTTLNFVIFCAIGLMFWLLMLQVENVQLYTKAAYGKCAKVEAILTGKI